MRIVVAILLLIVSSTASAADTPCAAPEHSQFDFWLGDWIVRDAAGKELGRNRIQKSNDGCVLHERWKSARTRHRGESFNVYDAPRKVWHQTWVDNDGLLLTIEGRLKYGAMVLEGDRPGRKGGSERHRITWTPRKDGTVRQHWQVSTDGGRKWTDSFDGIYSKR